MRPRAIWSKLHCTHISVHDIHFAYEDSHAKHTVQTKHACVYKYHNKHALLQKTAAVFAPFTWISITETIIYDDWNLISKTNMSNQVEHATGKSRVKSLIGATTVSMCSNPSSLRKDIRPLVLAAMSNEENAWQPKDISHSSSVPWPSQNIPPMRLN